MCHSIRKSLLSALYGIAVEKGDIDIDETIGSIGIDDTSPLTETEKSARVSDLLKARSGVYLPAAYETSSMKEDRPQRGSHEPGTHWYCNNWDFNTLATIYNRKTSNDLFKAFENQIAVPTQMQDFELRET
jgi:CubicO group peptidase (beta-lactamase class C family)